ncbi:MAG: polysaccharide deacetylase family protein [Acidimicrobiia bacterium]
MTKRLWITALISTLFVVGAVAVAQALPSAGSPDGAEVLGQQLSRSGVTVSTRVATAAGSRSSSTTTTGPTTTTTTTPAALRAGRMAAPSPATPVHLSESTPAIDHVPTKDKVIFLGIDDGLVRTPELLALLREERIPQTQFRPREPAVDGRDYFRALVALGATVEVHTVHHPVLTKLGWSDQHREICDEIPTITNGFGTRPSLFRPPYGEWNATTRSVVAGCGLRAIVLWRGATNDGRLDIVGGQFHPGDILLLHFRKDLVENLKLVLADARAQGYRIGRLEDYLGVGPPNPMFPRGGAPAVTKSAAEK